ncbi:MAG: hypothetical protein RBU27_08135 [Bacteroidota bacterium]|jgi:hypothetical protein|nr:hypothetical protein [Bacteroidota bacterium]
MPLSLNTWYRVAFPGSANTVRIMVTVGEYPDDIPDDHFVLELEAGVEFSIAKIRMDSIFGASLALCSNGMFCLDEATDMADVEADIISQSVMSAEIPNPWEWMPEIAPNEVELTLYLTRIPDVTAVIPCDNGQPVTAEEHDDPARGTVGAYPMRFDFPGETKGPGKPGKKIKVIWSPI